MNDLLDRPDDDNDDEGSVVFFDDPTSFANSAKHLKVALAMIVKGVDREAPLLDRALENIKPYVDNVFITLTHLPGEKPNQAVYDVCVKHSVCLSYYTWTNDFASARNFNFSQVPRDYNYIMWMDADDMFRGLEHLRPLLESHLDTDAFAMWYYYDFDEYKNPTVVHKKTMIVRNDGCVEWTGRLHEDFKENRQLRVKFVEDIERLHLTTEERSFESKLRNVDISRDEATMMPDDPRVYFNLGNSYFGAGALGHARDNYIKFLETSGSDDEKYVVRMRLSSVEQGLEHRKEAIESLQIAIGMNPLIPDAYHALGYLYFSYGMYDQAELYILTGLKVKPEIHQMIVFNPRDYDYNPMMALSKVYFQKNRADLALPWLRHCLAIYPKSEYLKGLVKEMTEETKHLAKVLEAIQHIDTLGNDVQKILYTIGKLPKDLQSHPSICRIRNEYVVKTESSGKDIAYFCGVQSFEWNPEMAKTKGIGGSEEAVINLSKQWAKEGYNVTVYNNCGLEPMYCDGVTYKPYWFYNPKDKYDVTILWRHPGPADHVINTTKLFVDLHDVIPPGEFNEKRLQRIDKVFVKTNSHRILFPNIPDEKIAIIPNGQDPFLFKEKVEKVPHLLVNTSSPDRSLDVLPKLFKMVKEQVPDARLKWAYGWDIFDLTFANDRRMMEWKDKVVNEMDEAGIENLGRLSQAECAKLYQEGVILAYPSEFYEIDCISVKKAQACGCVPITSDFAAFKESNKYGIKIPSKKTTGDWSLPYQVGFGITDEAAQKKWVAAVVKELRNPTDTKKMRSWADFNFNWDRIARWWIDETFNPLKRELQTNE